MAERPAGSSRLHDISIVVRPGTPEWPGDTPFSCGWAWDMAAGASVNVSAITMSPHVGTHADAPLHVREGAPGSDALPLDAFIGPAWVLALDDADGVVEWASIAARVPERCERLLLRTGRSIAEGRFPDSWPVLGTGAVAGLAGRGLRLLGVDAPSVDDRESRTLETHHALFGAGASVLENLDLRGIPEGACQLLALPLRLEGLDAAPVRALVSF
jgi:arylformamidase